MAVLSHSTLFSVCPPRKIKKKKKRSKTKRDGSLLSMERLIFCRSGWGGGGGVL